MPTFEQEDWYESPRYYDILLQEDNARDGDFLEAVLAEYGRSRGKRVLEPACGSGRLLLELAERGYEVTGVDLSPDMLAYARERLDQAGYRGRLVEAPMQDFEVRGSFDLAHCLVSSFKYLLDEASARAALESVGRALAPGGVLVLGLHLSEYDETRRLRERWVGRRGRTHVVCNLQSWPPDRARRRERLRSRLIVEEEGRTRRIETAWDFRTYDEGQLARLVASVKGLELLATHDFSYDLSRPADEDSLDRILVLCRPGGRSRS